MATQAYEYNPTQGDVIDVKKAVGLTQLHLEDAKKMALDKLGSTEPAVIAALVQAIAINFRNVKLR